MIKISADHVIKEIVEARLPRFSDPNKGLLVSIRAELENFNTKETTKRNIWFVFQRPNNYTRVFVYTSKRYFNFWEVFPENWVDICYHDTCWVEAVHSELFRIYMDIADPIAGNEPPIRLIDKSRFDFFNADEVKIKVEIDEKNNDHANLKEVELI